MKHRTKRSSTVFSEGAFPRQNLNFRITHDTIITNTNKVGIKNKNFRHCCYFSSVCRKIKLIGASIRVCFKTVVVNLWDNSAFYRKTNESFRKPFILIDKSQIQVERHREICEQSQGKFLLPRHFIFSVGRMRLYWISHVIAFAVTIWYCLTDSCSITEIFHRRWVIVIYPE